ncbi:MAG: hypothetical protein AAF580_15720 [Pseudomonadota bacterium]
MSLAAFIVEAVRVYALIGLCLAAIFLVIGIGRITPDARGAYVFRPLLIPGVVLLWPVVLLRWTAIERGAEGGQAPYLPPRRAQGFVALGMAALVLAVVATVFAMRSEPPVERAPVLLEAPQAPTGEP